MRRTLAGLALIIAVAAAGSWAVAVVAPPTSRPEREPALVVPAVGSPTASATVTSPGPLPSVTATASPNAPVPTSTATASTSDDTAPETVTAPKPSYYDDHGGNADRGRGSDDD